MIRQAITETNGTFLASGVNITLNLVDIYPWLNFNDYLSIGTVKGAFSDSSEIRQRRNAVAADIVLLIAFPSSGGCGQAYQGPMNVSAYGVVHVGCLKQLSFPHEVGHLLGADHNIGAPQPPLTVSGAAHGWPGSNDVFWVMDGGSRRYMCDYTIMAFLLSSISDLCPGNERLPLWSDPFKSLSYSPTQIWTIGSPSANNAAVLRASAQTVAAFRTASGGGTNPGTETGYVQKVASFVGVLWNKFFGD